MDYIAKHFMEIAGRKYTPGEIVEQEIDKDKLAFYLKTGALEPMESLFFARQELPNGDDAADMPDEDEEPEAEEAAVQETEEAMEIDAADGVVSPAAPKKSAMKAANRRKKA